MRKAAEEASDHDLERELYIRERKAELRTNWNVGIENLRKDRWKNRPSYLLRLAINRLWWIVMGTYWVLADYGRNFLVPAFWLGLSVPFFDWRYTEVLARLMAKAPDVDKYKRAVGMLALGNAVPFVGPLTIDAKINEFLFCPDNAASCLPPIPPEGFQFLVIAQNLISIVLVFFIALALRNYFKIK
jgi:hypothetical protein